MLRTSNVTMHWYTTVLILVVTVVLSLETSNRVSAGTSSKQKMIEVLNKAKELYLDVYPDLKTLNMYRDQKMKQEAKTLRKNLKRRISTRMKDIKNLVASLKPEDPDLQEKIAEFRRMVAYMSEFYKKSLIDQEKEHDLTLRERHLSLRAKMKRGIAPPEAFRKAFLAKMLGYMVNPFMNVDPVRHRLIGIDQRIQDLYWSVLPTYLELLGKWNEVRGDDDDSATKNEQIVLENIQREWRNFWSEEVDNRWEQLSNQINRQLLLFRNRDHLPMNQEINFKNAKRLKRQIIELKTFREKGNMFSNNRDLKYMLLFLAKKFAPRTKSTLEEYGEGKILAAYQSFHSLYSSSINVQSKSRYGDMKDQVQSVVQSITERQYNLDRAQNMIEKILVDGLEGLATRLTEFKKKEKEVAATLRKMVEITRQLKTFGKRARRMIQAFPGAYEAATFKKKDKNQFEKSILDNLEEDPEVLAEQVEQMSSKFQELRRKFEVIETLNVKLRKGSNETVE